MIYNLSNVFNKSIPDIKGCFIYRITNLINNMNYVGSTRIGLFNRFINTIWSHKIYYENKVNRQLYIDMNKYGIENFEVEILTLCSLNELFNLEEYYVNKLDSFNSGYNYTNTGRSNNLKQLWKNEEFRLNCLIRSSIQMKNLHKDENFKKAHTNRLSKRNKENWKDPKYREFMKDVCSKNIKNTWENNEKFRKEHSKRISKRITELNKNNDMKELQRLGKIKKLINKIIGLGLEINEETWNNNKTPGIYRYHIVIEKYSYLFDKRGN